MTSLIIFAATAVRGNERLQIPSSCSYHNPFEKHLFTDSIFRQSDQHSVTPQNTQKRLLLPAPNIVVGIPALEEDTEYPVNRTYINYCFRFFVDSGATDFDISKAFVCCCHSQSTYNLIDKKTGG